MFRYIGFKKILFKKILSFGLFFAFLGNGLSLPLADANELILPAPGTIVHLSPSFNPPILKGLKVHPHNPFRFDFVLDQGDSQAVTPESISQGSREQELRRESEKLIKYFLASLTVPEKDLWVNLSPYEKDRIVPGSFGKTEMGRDLLAQDYLLKQITASLIYPEDELGKKFWKRVYEESAKKFGTTDIPVNTFNKVWIVPEKAVVYENTKAGTAYVVESKLKVMLEQDYLAMDKNNAGNGLKPFPADVNQIGSNIVREIVIPQLTQEINQGKNFAQLRQVYHSLILATWYKKKIKDNILNKVYADRNKIKGTEYADSAANDVEAIYQQYLTAFKKGVYSYIKEDLNLLSGHSIPRKYFSGGVASMHISKAMTTVEIMDQTQLSRQKDLRQITAEIRDFDTKFHIMERKNHAMLSWPRMVFMSAVMAAVGIGLVEYLAVINRKISLPPVMSVVKDPMPEAWKARVDDLFERFKTNGRDISSDDIGLLKQQLRDIKVAEEEKERIMQVLLEVNLAVAQPLMEEYMKGNCLGWMSKIQNEFKFLQPRSIKDIQEKINRLKYAPQQRLSYEDVHSLGIIGHGPYWYDVDIALLEMAARLFLNEDTPAASQALFAGLIASYYKREPVIGPPASAEVRSIRREIDRLMEDDYSLERTQQEQGLWEIAVRAAYDAIGQNKDPRQIAQAVMFRLKDQAMKAENIGGIDFTVDKTPLEVKRDSRASPASRDGINFLKSKELSLLLEHLQNAPGFVPVIINIQPLNNLPEFLGLSP